MDKEAKYIQLKKQILSLTEGESNTIANLANTAALIKGMFSFLWVGFYLVDEQKAQLVLGPFQGPVACTRIPFGRGVCGDAWKMKKSICVDDVSLYSGHIACSSYSKSELVVPIIKNEKVLAVLDLDSEQLSSFDEVDQSSFEDICDNLSNLF